MGEPTRASRAAAATPARPGERLQKVLAAAGIASRRECEQLILEGRVEVDGQIVSELGAKVDRQKQNIRVDGEPLAQPRPVYLAVHKPAGVVTTARDPAGRPRVTDLVPPSLGRVFPVGRLDMESEGLILLTNDGDMADRLTHPKHGVRKIYEVQVAGFPEPDVLAQLKKGVYLSDGFAHAVNVKVRGRRKKSTLLEMVLDEGRNREVRRLLARVGHKVQRLTRVAVGPIRLGELPKGAYRPLSDQEISKLHHLEDVDQAQADQPPPRRYVGGPPKRHPAPRKGGRPKGPGLRASGAVATQRRQRSVATEEAGAASRRVIGAEGDLPTKQTRADEEGAKKAGRPPRRKFGAGGKAARGKQTASKSRGGKGRSGSKRPTK